MFRRHDKLGQMAATLFAAVIVGGILEAEGLRIWAERLNVGSLRDNALPFTSGWSDANRWLHTAIPRNLALSAKAGLADDMVLAKADTAESSEAVSADSAEEGSKEPVQLAAAEGTELAAIKRHTDAGPAPGGGTVVLSGDSMMAVGLAPTLTRWLGREKNARVVRAFRSGTGLSRPDVYDWQVEYPRMVGNTRPSLIICSMGANDAQNVQAGKKVLAFGTPEWDALYNARLKAYLEMITRYKAPILWVGLPTMKSPVFAQKMAHMNALIQAGIAAYPQITWLDSNGPLGYTGRGFQQFKANDKGKLIKLRSDDGIHLTDEGALFLMPSISQWVKRTAPNTPAKDDPTLAAAQAAPATSSPAVAPAKSVPPATLVQLAPAPADPAPPAAKAKPAVTSGNHFLADYAYPRGWVSL